MNFFERLMYELEFHGKSKSDLARYLNTRPSTIQSWQERGNIPSADIVLKISKYLNVSMEYLITGGKENEPEPKLKLVKKDSVPINDDVMRFYKAYLILDERDKQMIETVLDSLLSHYTDTEEISS